MRYYVVGDPFDNAKPQKTSSFCGLWSRSEKTVGQKDFIRQLKLHETQNIFSNLVDCYSYAGTVHAKRPSPNFLTPIFGVELAETTEKTVPTKLVIGNLIDVEFYMSTLPNLDFKNDKKTTTCTPFCA